MAHIYYILLYCTFHIIYITLYLDYITAMFALPLKQHCCQRGCIARGGVEDTRLEAKAKAKDTKKIRGQGQGQRQPFRGQTLSRPRTGMLEAKAKDQGHSRKGFPKKNIFKKVFQAISNL